MELVEDCYQEACIRALHKWKLDQIPTNPPAWLYTVSRNIAIDFLRKNSRELPLDTINNDYFETEMVEHNLFESKSFDQEVNKQTYKDDVLWLLFSCCHPELSIKDQMALALKIVGGLTTSAVTKTFLCKEKAMEQRLTRAKKRQVN